MRAAVGGGCALLVWWLSPFVAELWFWFWWQSWSLWEVTGLSCDDTLVEMVSFYQSGWDAYAARYGAEEDDKDYPLPGGSKRLSLASFAAESATYRGGWRNQPRIRGGWRKSFVRPKWPRHNLLCLKWFLRNSCAGFIYL